MKNLIAFFAKAYDGFIKGASFLQDPILLILRLYFGWTFCIGGWGKLHNIGQVSGFFESLHIPFPTLNAYLAGSTECFGGLFLLLGLASRLVSIPLIFTMCIAYATAEKDSLAALFLKKGLAEDEGRADQFLKATPFMFLLTALLVLACGPGRISLDWIIGKIYKNKIKHDAPPPRV